MIGRLYTWREKVWVVVTRGEPFDRGPRRNVLLQRVEVVHAGPGFTMVVAVTPRELVVRPFRGLRRLLP